MRPRIQVSDHKTKVENQVLKTQNLGLDMKRGLMKPRNFEFLNLDRFKVLPEKREANEQGIHQA